MLNVLVRGQFSDTEPDYEKILHFEDVDETTRRLVVRCATVDWLRPVEEAVSESAEGNRVIVPPQPIVTEVTESPLEISKSISKTEIISPETVPPLVDPTARTDSDHKSTHAERLGMHLDRGSSSSLSVQEVAAQHEKPGIITPSRADTTTTAEDPHSPARKQKVKPEPPKTRRWRGRHPTLEETTAIKTTEVTEQHTVTTRSVIDRRNSAGA